MRYYIMLSLTLTTSIHAGQTSLQVQRFVDRYKALDRYDSDRTLNNGLSGVPQRHIPIPTITPLSPESTSISSGSLGSTSTSFSKTPTLSPKETPITPPITSPPFYASSEEEAARIKALALKMNPNLFDDPSDTPSGTPMTFVATTTPTDTETQPTPSILITTPKSKPKTSTLPQTPQRAPRRLSSLVNAPSLPSHVGADALLTQAKLIIINTPTSVTPPPPLLPPHEITSTFTRDPGHIPSAGNLSTHKDMPPTPSSTPAPVTTTASETAPPTLEQKEQKANSDPVCTCWCPC